MKRRFISCLIFLIVGLMNLQAAGHDAQLASARKQYDSAIQQRSISRIIRAYMAIGDAYKKNKIDSAYMNYAYALKLSDRFSIQPLRPLIFYELALLQQRGYNFNDAVVLFDSAKNAAIRQGDWAVASNVFNMLGTLQLDIWSKAEAKTLFEKAYHMALSHNLPRQAGVALGNLSRLTDNEAEAVKLMKTAIILIKSSSGALDEVGYIYINIGNRMTNPDSAMFYYEKAINIGQKGDYRDMLINAWNNIAYSFLEKKQFREADVLIEKTAIPMARSESDFEWLAELYDTWSDVKAAQNDYPGAWKAEKEAMSARSEAEIKKSTEQVRLLILLLELKSKDLLLTSSELTVKKQEGNIRSLRLVMLMLFVIVLLVSMGSFGIYFVSKIRVHRKELDLTKRQIEIEDDERKRLSMQLHDLTGTLDQKIINGIDKLSISEPSLKIELIQEWKGVSSTIHAISYRLNKNMVEGLPFPSLIQNIIEEYRELSQLTIEFDLLPGITFSPNQQYHLFSIIQELLNNARKYVKNGSVLFKLTTEFGNHYLVYEDNGPGFNAESIVTKSMGIQNIKDRTAIMGGKATLTTSPGKGTRWIIVIPQISENKQPQIGFDQA